MKVSLKTMLPIMTLGLATLTSCTSCSDSYSRTKDYCYKHGKTQEEFEEIVNAGGDKWNSAKRQSKLDSMAYRDIFNTTSAVKDSATVAEFNKLAKKYLTDGETSKKCKENLKAEKISAKEYGDIFYNSDTSPQMQHEADKWGYRNFFKKIGIMTPEFEKKCDEAEKEMYN